MGHYIDHLKTTNQ